MQHNDAIDFMKDVVLDARDVALEPALWVPALSLSLSTDLLMEALEWPFRGGPVPTERTITTMVIVTLAKGWFGLTLCRIGVALLRRQVAGFLNNWVPVQTAIRIGVVGLLLMAPVLLGALLVLPGLYMLARWSQVAMLQLDGHAKWFDAAGQSAMLTEGYKLPILGLWAVMLIAGAAVEFVGVRLGLGGAGAIGILFSAAVNALASLAGVALAAATYYELSRRAPWEPETRAVVAF